MIYLVEGPACGDPQSGVAQRPYPTNFWTCTYVSACSPLGTMNMTLQYEFVLLQEWVIGVLAVFGHKLEDCHSENECDTNHCPFAGEHPKKECIE